jgi:alkanesulfonate monooxygenase SsuD/methylene tetrahydromethanopterin reductase-like flavin-dependent oxidoreductase (luciferase family)
MKGPLPIWLATGGNAGSPARAGQLGPPVSYGIIDDAPQRFAPLAQLYRATAAKAGHVGGNIKLSIAAIGLVAPSKKEALDRFYPGWHNLNVEMGQLRGWAAPDKRDYLAQTEAPGSLLRRRPRRSRPTHHPPA